MPDRIKYPLPPWKVMPDPDNKGRHVFHDHRWIATADAEVEYGYDSRSWGLSKGSLICEMRDLDPEAAHRIVDCVNACNGLNPAAVATMPETLELLEDIEKELHLAGLDQRENNAPDVSSLPAKLCIRLHDVIQKAKGAKNENC